MWYFREAVHQSLSFSCRQNLSAQYLSTNHHFGWRLNPIGFFVQSHLHFQATSLSWTWTKQINWTQPCPFAQLDSFSVIFDWELPPQCGPNFYYPFLARFCLLWNPLSCFGICWTSSGVVRWFRSCWSWGCVWSASSRFLLHWSESSGIMALQHLSYRPIYL